MAISFNSVGHFFAKAFTAIKTTLTKVEGTETTVEAVTGAIPVVGTPAVAVERAAYAVLGEISSVLTAGGAAASAKLSDAGLDTAVITQIENLLASIPTLVAVAKGL